MVKKGLERLWERAMKDSQVFTLTDVCLVAVFVYSPKKKCISFKDQRAKRRRGGVVSHILLCMQKAESKHSSQQTEMYPNYESTNLI